MDYLPLFCQLQQKACLLVGGGEIAERKARLLIAAGADLTVNAEHFNNQFIAWAEQGVITLEKGGFLPHLLAEKWLVIAATDQLDINAFVYQCANQHRIFCNAVDDPKHASFIMPAIIDRSPIMVAFSSGGRAPVLVRLLKEKLEAVLPQHLGKLAQLAGTLRQRVKQQFTTFGARRRFWEKFFTHDRLAQSLANDDPDFVTQQVEHLFLASSDVLGEVVLVGAGPGDPGLLTLKGLQQLQHADVVIYDRLVSPEVLALARRDARCIFVGKQKGHHCVSQQYINQLLIEQAQLGKRVVRLKGGDPFIFGRGGEELESLVEAGIPFSVVPGITAASGCSAYSGIPLTHRDYAQSVKLITGHAKTEGKKIDWRHLATEQQTLVFYMGLSQAGEIQRQLIAHGMNLHMPVAIIERGTTRHQRVIAGELRQLEDLAKHTESPCLMIVGDVVNLRKKLNWFISSRKNEGHDQR